MTEPRSLPRTPAVIVGVGARTASGLTALQVTMSARAHKFVPRVSHLIDRNGDAIATGRLASISDSAIGIDRFLALGSPALTQAAFPWLTLQRSAVGRIPVVVALPSESRPGFDPRLKKHLLGALEARSRVPVDHERSRLFMACRGGGVLAFTHALAELQRGACEAIAVGGIDSYFDPDVLEHLDAELRLHGPETENGFIPGEGAAFVLLAARRHAAALTRYGQIIATGTADEPRPWGSDEPSQGLGLTLAVRRAAERAALGERGISWMLTDVANERHRVDEWMYAAARNHRFFTLDAQHDQPLLKTGDVGAASAATLLCMAAVRWQTGCAAAEVALIATQSDGSERGAMVVSREGQA